MYTVSLSATMLCVGRLPPPSAPLLIPIKSPISFSLLFQHHTNNCHKVKQMLLLSQDSLSNYSLSLSGRTGFSLFAQKNGKNSSVEVIKMEEDEGFDDEEEDDDFDFDEDYEFDDEDEDFDDEVEEEDDALMVPFHKMNDWLEKKPKGFGEGKVYDTALEDKLLEEIELALKAQIANIDKLKSETKKSNSKNELHEELFKAPEGVSGGIRVRINNLPKKKNIYRDLKSAFEGVPGIINVSPVNSGNKKTRDPICKGLALVDFKSVKDANRFVQMFSGQIVSFGKSEKPIKCEILKPLDVSCEELSYEGFNRGPEESFTFLEEEDEEDDIEINDIHLELREDDDDYEDLVEGPDGKYVLGNSEKLSIDERTKRIEMIEAKLLAHASMYEEEMKAVKQLPEVKNKTDKKPSQKTDKKPSHKTDKKPNLKSEKKPKLSIPGSAKKLKVKEKAKLADVFSRYGKREAKASKEM